MKRERVFNIRYASIRNLDVSNGEGVGISLFVQGCPFKCYNCFNPETWDFNGGKEWTKEVENEFIELAKRPYIKRISILGGEPLAEENLDGVLKLVNKIRLLFGNDKTIWLYSGFTWNSIFDNTLENMIDKGIGGLSLCEECEQALELTNKRREIISLCNVLVDGRYVDSERDITLKWRGSKNQRCINIKESLEQKKVVLWCD